MIALQNSETVWMVAPTVATNGETITSLTLDKLNYDYVSIAVQATTSNNATNNPSTFKLQESDTDVASNFADITAFVGDTAFTIPNSPTATATTGFAILNVDCKTRKRYLRLLITPITTQTYAAVAVLGRAKQVPVGTTAQGALVVVNG